MSDSQPTEDQVSKRSDEVDVTLLEEENDQTADAASQNVGSSGEAKDDSEEVNKGLEDGGEGEEEKDEEENGGEQKVEEEEEEEDEDDEDEQAEEDETDEDECEEYPLENLSTAQLETLLSKKEREQRRSKKKTDCLATKKEWLELKKKRTMAEEEALTEIIIELHEEEARWDALVKNISCIKKFMKVPEKHKGAGRFDAASIPQVILCSPWEDSKVPKVVVCSTPREGKMDSLTKEFLKVLSPEQLAIIEKEKQWMAIECGKIRLQIAGIKGKIKVVTRENGTLRTLVDSTVGSGGNINVIMPDDLKPCYGAAGVPEKAFPCPTYAPKPPAEVPIEINLSSMALSNRRSIGQEVSYVENRIKLLQDDLVRAMNERNKLAREKLEAANATSAEVEMVPPNTQANSFDSVGQ